MLIKKTKKSYYIIPKTFGLSMLIYSIIYLSGVSCRNEDDQNELISLENAMIIDGSSDLSNIFTPIDISVDANGNIFILDPVTMEVLKFNPAGDYLTSFGGIGEAPWEFSRTCFNFDISNTGRIYVIDIPNTVKVFSNEGEFLDNIHVDLDKVFDVAVLDSSMIYVSGHPNSIMLSEVSENSAVFHINTEGEILHEYGNLHMDIEDLGLKNMFFDCAIDVDRDSSVYLTSVGNYQVNKFDSAGDLIWATDGAIEYEPYSISHGEEGSELVPVVMDLDVEANRVFVLWAQGVTDNGYRVDVYDADNGHLEGYFYTLVPSDTRNWSIEITDNHFFVVDYENAIVYRYDMVFHL
jgi:hypothetical protein